MTAAVVAVVVVALLAGVSVAQHYHLFSPDTKC